MATSKAIRADDASGLNIATIQATEDAVTKDWQRVVLNDPTTPANMATVSGGALKVDGSGVTQPASIAGTVNVKPTDGTNAISKTFDLDSSGTTHEWNVGVGLRKKASGGSVELGTSSDPIRTDPTGTTVQPVSAASLPLPNGAATAAKQPALGTAGSASADVISIQGVASMTAVKVDGSAVTQPVSGTVTANIGTSGSLALDASVTGLQVAQGSTTSGQKGSLAQGAVTTNAPSYTTAQTSPLSLDTSGLLRVSVKDTPQNTNAFKVDGSAVTQPVSISGNQAVNLAQVAGASTATGHGTASGAIRVELPTDGTGVVNAAQSGTWTVQPGNTANTTPWLVQSVPATSGGLGAPFSASQTSTKGVVKASAGTLYGYEIVNNGSTLCYIQLFNKLTANVTVGTTAPDWVIPVPAPSSGTAGAGIVHELDKGYSFSTGLVIACTTTRTGSTSATCDVNFFFD